MKIKLETVQPDKDSSFRILLTPNLNDQFYWHFHPEYEIVLVKTGQGTRHIGDHISRYQDGDLAFIGPNIPHLNFDYGLPSTCEIIVVQMKEDFLGKDFLQIPEVSRINTLFERGRSGLIFSGRTKQLVSDKMEKLPGMNHFEQLVELLQILQLLAESNEALVLNSKPISTAAQLKEQERLQKIIRYLETNYQQRIDVNELARHCHLTTAAFCRYFKKTTRSTFTEFLNTYRINQAKKLLLQQFTVTEACYDSGFDNLSHFNKMFKRIAGENPSVFRKKHLELQA